MRWEQDDAPEASAGQRPDDVTDDPGEGLIGKRQRAREREVMVRASDLHGRRHERVESIRDHLREVIAEQHIGFERQVGSVLLERAQCRHDRIPASLNPGFHLRPRQGVQLDRAHRALVSSTFHCGGCLTLRCGLTDADVHRSAQRPERRSHLARKEFRLFPRGEVTAFLDFVEVHEVGVGTLGPPAR